MRLSRVIARATVIAVAIEGFATAFTVQNPASSKAVIPTLSPIHHSFSSSIYRQRRSNEFRTRIYVQVEESQKIDASVEVENDKLIDVEINSDPTLNVKTTATLIAGQSVMIGVAALASQILNVPNFGLGPDFLLSNDSIQAGFLATLPLFALAAILDVVEKYVPALEDVSKATQRSVLALMGGERQLGAAIVIALALGAAAGIGEEMLFRGVLQSELSNNMGELLALGSSAVIFGLLHAVTPLYAFLAGLASLYFGELYIQYHNLAVPIVCHGIYDVGALVAAHWQVSGMSKEERISLANWNPPGKTDF
jgi:membrane protease YdiL (CAAX protease family)